MRQSLSAIGLLAALAIPLAPALGGINEWTYVGLAPEVVTDIKVHPANPDIIFASALDVFWDTTREGGLFKTTDHGLTWDTLGFRHSNVMGVAIDPLNPSTVWIANDMAGAWRSTDDGQTWENRSQGMYLGGADDFGALTLAVSPTSSDLLLCGGAGWAGPGWICRTTDGGLHWTEVEWEHYLIRILFDPHVEGRVFGPLMPLNQIYMSVDDGETYEVLPSPMLYDLALNPARADWIWTMARGSFQYTPDLGQTWVRPDTTFPPAGATGWYVISSWEDENQLAATTATRVFWTENGGRSWASLDRGWGTNWTTAALALVAATPPEIWVGSTYGSVFAYAIVDTSDAARPAAPARSTWNVRIWPNPASDSFTLDGVGPSGWGTVSLYNILGRTVLRETVMMPGGTFTFRVPTSWPSGMYVVTVSPQGRTLQPKSIQLTITR